MHAESEFYFWFFDWILVTIFIKFTSPTVYVVTECSEGVEYATRINHCKEIVYTEKLVEVV